MSMCDVVNESVTRFREPVWCAKATTTTKHDLREVT